MPKAASSCIRVRSAHLQKHHVWICTLYSVLRRAKAREIHGWPRMLSVNQRESAWGSVMQRTGDAGDAGAVADAGSGFSCNQSIYRILWTKVLEPGICCLHIHSTATCLRLHVCIKASALPGYSRWKASWTSIAYLYNSVNVSASRYCASRDIYLLTWGHKSKQHKSRTRSGISGRPVASGSLLIYTTIVASPATPVGNVLFSAQTSERMLNFRLFQGIRLAWANGEGSFYQRNRFEAILWRTGSNIVWLNGSGLLKWASASGHAILVSAVQNALQGALQRYRWVGSIHWLMKYLCVIKYLFMKD